MIKKIEYLFLLMFLFVILLFSCNNSKVLMPNADENINSKKELIPASELCEGSITGTKMNVFYVGVDNPIEIMFKGLSIENLKVSISGAGGGTLKKGTNGSYLVNVNRPTRMGEYTRITVSNGGESFFKEFRVKRIPDPIAKISHKRGGRMSVGEFKTLQGVFAVLENFDFNAKCKVSGFSIARVTKGQEIEIIVNNGSKFTTESALLISMAIPGDRYLFENIKCKCEGDVANRSIGSIAVQIR